MSKVEAKGEASDDASSSEGTPPPLPVRPSALKLLEKPSLAVSPARPSPNRPQLQSKATTGISRAEVQSYAGGTNDGTLSLSAQRSSPRSNIAYRQASRAGSLYGDRASISTIGPSIAGADFEPLFDDFIPDCADGEQAGQGQERSGNWPKEVDEVPLFSVDSVFEAAFRREFDDVQSENFSEGKAYQLLTGYRRSPLIEFRQSKHYTIGRLN